MGVFARDSVDDAAAESRAEVASPAVAVALPQLSKIETDFAGWSKADKRRACVGILNPIDLETARAGGLGAGDLNGWDTYGLFSGLAEWLRRPPVSPPCATPSSSAPKEEWRHKGHEDPRTCSNTMQVGNGCWLAGTVNYATFGTMVSLCRSTFFTGDPEIGGEQGALEHALSLIRGYKMFVSKEVPKWPLAWTEEVYRGGPGAITGVGNGNRAGSSTTCGQNAKIDPSRLVSWDYVWEPVHPRVPDPKPAAPAAAASGSAPAP